MNLKPWIITVVACLVIFLGLAFFKVTEIRSAIAFAESFPEPSETVESVLVKAVQYTPSIEVMGEVIAPRQLDIRNELPGEIVGVFFESGALVEENQILLQQDISIEQANLAAALARAELAKSVYERAAGLYKSKAGSKEQLDRAKAELSTTLAEVEALKRNIDKKTVRAPFSGKVGLHRFEAGQYILDNTLITSLVEQSSMMWVDFKVPQFYSTIKVDQSLTLKVIGNAQVKKTVGAQVIAENVMLSRASRSRSYRAEFNNQTLALVPNTMVSVTVPVGAAVQLLSIPATAIQQDPLGQFVYVLEEDAAKNGFRAVRRQVTVSRVENNNAYVSGEISEGMRVAAAGAFKLRESLLVFIKERNKPGSDIATDTQSSSVAGESR